MAERLHKTLAFKDADKNVPVVELESVSKVYPMDGVQVNALKNASLEIFKGEFVAITGKSGSGKSTLLHIIGCLDLPTAGRLKLDGMDVSTMNDSELARLRGKKIGFVFQSFNLMNKLTALEGTFL